LCFMASQTPLLREHEGQLPEPAGLRSPTTPECVCGGVGGGVSPLGRTPTGWHILCTLPDSPTLTMAKVISGQPAPAWRTYRGPAFSSSRPRSAWPVAEGSVHTCVWGGKWCLAPWGDPRKAPCALDKSLAYRVMTPSRRHGEHRPAPQPRSPTSGRSLRVKGAQALPYNAARRCVTCRDARCPHM
jgi:hypothetical protein